MENSELERQIFENTLSVMKEYGPEPVLSFLSTKFLRKKENVKKAMLSYYESTEEFEKCMEIQKFFGQLEILVARKKETKDN
jgi:hypothetical protein